MKLGTAKQADPALDAAEMVSIQRTGDRPLRFKGIRIAQYDHDAQELCGQVTLWQCRTGGLVVQIELDGPLGLCVHAERVRTLEEGTSFLEGLMSGAELEPEPKLSGGKKKPASDVGALMLVRARNQAVRSAYSQMVSCCSAAFAHAALREFRDQ